MLGEVISFLKKNIAQSVRLFGIFFLCFCLLQIGFLYAYHTYQKKREDACKVILSWNVQSILENGMNHMTSLVKDSDVRSLVKSSYVKSVNCVQTINVSVNGDAYNLIGQTDTKALASKHFVAGGSLSSKDTSTQAVISREMAEQENIKIGEHITVKTSKAAVKMKVIGIYEDKDDQTIYTALKVAQKLNGSSKTMTSAVFQFENKKKMNDFMQYAYKQNMNWDQLHLRIEKHDETHYDIFPVILPLAIAILLMSLALLKLVKKREKEFITRYFMGESVKHIILQLLLETFMIALPALLLASYLLAYFIPAYDLTFILINLMIIYLILMLSFIFPLRKLRRNIYVSLNA